MQIKNSIMSTVIKNKSTWLYILVVLVVSVLFIFSLLISDKQAVISQENQFNRQQQLQTFLAKQAMDDHVNRHYNEAFLITSNGIAEYIKNPENLQLLKDQFRSVQVISPEMRLIAYYESPIKDVYTRSLSEPSVKSEENANIVLAQCKQWAAMYWDEAFANAPQPYFPSLYIKKDIQIYGIMTPVLEKGEKQGVLVMVLDLKHMVNQYIAPMHSGKYGTAFLYGGDGLILYDADPEKVGRNIHDGMHAGYPELKQLDQRLLSELSGTGEYSLRGLNGSDDRRLVAWDTVQLGDQKLIIGLSAPDYEIVPMLAEARIQRITLGLILIVVLLMVSVVFFRYRQGLIEQISDELKAQIKTRNAELYEANKSLQEEIAERKRVEQVLRENEERLNLIIRNTNDGVFDINLVTNEAYYSPRYFQMLGYEVGELPQTRESWINLLHPEDRQWAVAVQDENIEKANEDLEISFRLRKKDGSYAWILSRSSIVDWDKHGKAKRFLGTHVDVTEFKQVQQALAASEERYRLLFESSLDGFVVADNDMNIVLCNRAYCEMVGYSAEELLTMNIYDLTPQRYRAWQRKYMEEEVIPRGYSGLYEKEYIRKDGSVFPIEARAYLQKDKNGKPTGMWAFVRDITERTKTQQELKEYRQHLEDLVQLRTQELEDINSRLKEEIIERKQVEESLRLSETKFRSIAEALRASEKRLRAIFNNAAVGIVIHNNEGIIIQNNHSFAKMMHLNSDELIGFGIKEITHPDDEQVGVSELKKMRKGQIDLYRIQNRYIRRDGSYFWADVSVTPIRNDEDELEAVIGVVIDITDLKYSQESLQLAKEAAEAANLAKSRFLANMSHELRTPLNAILGFSQIMRRDPQLTPMQQDNLATISRSGDHLLALINDILELSKIEAGRVVIQNKTFDLYRLISDLESMFSLRVGEKSLVLSFTYGDAVPQYIMADEGKLRQIMMNLLSNAVKFTQRGNVTVRICSYKPRSSTKDEKPTLFFNVSDTGPGISHEEQESIFDAFVQSNSTNISSEGTGLGLPISRQFVQAMGGVLTVRSQPGLGSTFKFFIPYQTAAPGDEPEESVRRRVIGIAKTEPQYRILVADDHRESRELMNRLLSLYGFIVREAANGMEAVKIWNEWQPHLIWMDMRMPVMDGFEATRKIKTEQRGKDTKIIALTASAFEEDREIMLAQGCDDFVRKPFHEQEIVDKLERCLGVQFIYDDQSSQETDSHSLMTPAWKKTDKILPQDMAALPLKWRQEIKKAAVALDADSIIRLCEGLRLDGFAVQAEGINELANYFNYKRILSLLDAAQELEDQD